VEGPISPLFKADSATLTFSRGEGGKMRVVFSGWDDPKVALPGQHFEIVLGPQGVEGRILGEPRKDPPPVLMEEDFW
jgi:hypothetical protein